MKKISIQHHKDIAQHLKEGVPHCQIAKQYGVSIGTVSNIRKTMPEALPAPKIGCPKKLQFHHHCFLKHPFKSNTVKTVWQACHAVKECFNIGISCTTMHKALIKLCFCACVIKKKSLLTKKHCQDCLCFAQMYKNWTVDDWKGVIWSDKTKINCLGSDGHRYCWLKASGLTSNIILPTMKFGSRSIMVWGCMTWGGIGKISVIKGMMTSKIYISILKENLVPTMDAL